MKSLTALSFSRRLRVVLIAAFIAALIAPATIFAQSTFSVFGQLSTRWSGRWGEGSKKAPRGKMTFTPKSLPFGRVQAGTSSQMSVSLTNTSAVAIDITKITATGAGFSAAQNCLGTLGATTGACGVVVTFAPATAKNAKGTKVTGKLTIKDNASNSPQDVTLSATKFGPVVTPTPTPTSGGGPTPTPTPTSTPTPTAGHATPTPAPTAGSGTPFAIQAAGLYAFNTGSTVTSPQIVEYQTTVSSGATSQSGTVATGTGVRGLSCTFNGNYCYGLDSTGNIWGYSVQSSTGLLTSVGSPTAPPSGSVPSSLEFYGSSVLWAAAPNFIGGTITFEQYPINGDGALGTPTAATLTGSEFQMFFAPGSKVQTAVWAVSGSAGSFTLNVYPVNSNGTISATSIQAIAVPEVFLFGATTGGFAYSVAGTSGSALTLYTFSLSSNGTLTANPTVALPTTTGFWGPANIFVPGIGNTLDLVDETSSNNFLVYPINSSGVVGTSLQSMPLGGIAEFPFSESINTSSGAAALSLLPTLWVHAPGSTTIDEFAISSSNGTIGASSGSVTTGAGVEGLSEIAPLTYGIDSTAGAVWGYQVSSDGALTSLGSFAPAIPSGQAFEQAAPFKPILYSASPVALFVYSESSSGEAAQLQIYPVGSNGMPAAMATPLDTISFTGESTESYVILQNGEVQIDAFGGL